MLLALLRAQERERAGAARLRDHALVGVAAGDRDVVPADEGTGAARGGLGRHVVRRPWPAWGSRRRPFWSARGGGGRRPAVARLEAIGPAARVVSRAARGQLPRSRRRVALARRRRASSSPSRWPAIAIRLRDRLKRSRWPSCRRRWSPACCRTWMRHHAAVNSFPLAVFVPLALPRRAGAPPGARRRADGPAKIYRHDHDGDRRRGVRGAAGHAGRPAVITRASTLYVDFIQHIRRATSSRSLASPPPMRSTPVR